MTVISAILTKSCIAVASDSLITSYKKEEPRVKTYKRSKIVYYDRLNCSASYWGLACDENEIWTTYNWLNSLKKTSLDCNNLEDFANLLHRSLKIELKKFSDKDSIRNGIGIHLVGYEKVGDQLIPELFLISNFIFESGYTKLRDEGLGISRETYGTVTKYFPALKNENHNEEEKRQVVYNYFESGYILSYNNGDPATFNPAAKAIFDSINANKGKNRIKSMDNEAYRSLAKRPIEIVKKVQNDFFIKDKILVGGVVHDLVFNHKGKIKKGG